MDSSLGQAELDFVPFHPSYAADFGRINREWLEEMFELEDSEIPILNSPYESIIQPGGHIYFARLNGKNVGTCALKRVAEDTFELTKMSVLKGLRGQKVGERLLHFVIGEAQRLEVKMLFLLTNSKCKAAIHLYEKNGFSHDAAILESYGSTYKRCDTAMLYKP